MFKYTNLQNIDLEEIVVPNHYTGTNKIEKSWCEFPYCFSTFFEVMLLLSEWIKTI